MLGVLWWQSYQGLRCEGQRDRLGALDLSCDSGAISQACEAGGRADGQLGLQCNNVKQGWDLKEEGQVGEVTGSWGCCPRRKRLL